ncbi:hypothetical protein [Blastomonas fulva]|jgi:hypothetical protein|uniref:hypothetical protein n=1 Tax=Blastomonas fulva TaxID=1550728 RepID=UPI003D2AF158
MIMAKQLRLSVALATLLAIPQQAVAGYDCRSSIDDYKSALSDIEFALRLYTGCLGASRGEDDCSSEFLSLQNAHNDFESAVEDIETNCNE